jgi:hypothetical protein
MTQDIVTAALAIAAIGFLAWRMLRSSRKKSCDKCD